MSKRFGSVMSALQMFIDESLLIVLSHGELKKVENVIERSSHCLVIKRRVSYYLGASNVERMRTFVRLQER